MQTPLRPKFDIDFNLDKEDVTCHGVQRRCKNGHGFHPKEAPCPLCGDQPKFNKGLRTAQLNSHLYKMAENA